MWEKVWMCLSVSVKFIAQKSFAVMKMNELIIYQPMKSQFWEKFLIWSWNWIWIVLEWSIHTLPHTTLPLNVFQNDAKSRTFSTNQKSSLLPRLATSLLIGRFRFGGLIGWDGYQHHFENHILLLFGISKLNIQRPFIGFASELLIGQFSFVHQFDNPSQTIPNDRSIDS